MSNSDPKDEKSGIPISTMTETGAFEAESSIIGRVLGGKYKILERIGGGGMGSVYKAEQTYFDRIVAVKILHPHLCVNKTFLQRFQQEARISSRVVHPNAVKLYDFGVDQNLPYLVLEFVQGTTLKDTLTQNGALPLSRVNRVLQQTCSALASAHALNIVHRDLKPDNIMLSVGSDGKETVRVLDFGIAKVLHGSGESGGTLMTQVGMLMGTPAYISPELAMEKELDARSDIYSIGVVLYEMLTAEVPFKSSSPLETYIQHIRNEPRPVRTLRPELNIPQEISDVVMKTLEKDPDRRFQSAMELAVAFDTALKSVSVEEQEKAPALRTVSGTIDPFRPLPDILPTDPASTAAALSETNLLTTPGKEFARKAPTSVLWASAGAGLIALLCLYALPKLFSTPPAPSAEESQMALSIERPAADGNGAAEVEGSEQDEPVADSAEAETSTSEVVSEPIGNAADDPSARAMAPGQVQEGVSTELASSGATAIDADVPPEADAPPSASVVSEAIAPIDLPSQTGETNEASAAPDVESETQVIDKNSTIVPIETVSETSEISETAALASITTSEGAKETANPSDPQDSTGIELDTSHQSIRSKLFAPEVISGLSTDAPQAKGEAEKLYKQAEKLLDRKEYADAALLLRKSVTLNPKELLAQLSFGNALMRLGLFQDARAALLAAIELDSQYAPAHYTLAANSALSGDSDAAVESLHKALALFPAARKWLSTDSDFDTLRNDPRFVEITAEK